MADKNVKTVPALSIRSRPEAGFRRAGRRWGPEETIVPLSELKDEQIKALRAEGKKKGGQLVVIDTEMPANVAKLGEDAKA